MEYTISRKNLSLLRQSQSLVKTPAQIPIQKINKITLNSKPDHIVIFNDVPKNWELLVLKSLIKWKNMTELNCITKKQFEDFMLPLIIKFIECSTKTPSNTLSRTLQLLRDRNIIEFVKRGVYQFNSLVVEFDKLQIIKQSNKSEGHLLLVDAVKSATTSNCNIIEEYLIETSRYRIDVMVKCGGLRIGFEYDGEQHFKPVSKFGGQDGFLATQIRDNNKNVLCSKLGIRLCRIPYYEKKNISKIVSNFIKLYF